MIESMVMPVLIERERGKWRGAYALLAALLGHGALLALALQQEPVLVLPLVVTEVELMPVHAPKPKPEPLPLPEQTPQPAQPASLPRAEKRTASARPHPPSIPQPASAAPLRTIEETVKTSDEPVRFVTDPNGSAFGYGTVARGGTAQAGAPAVAASPAPAATTGQAGPAPALSRAPMLAEADPCRGFFPSRASVDRGEVALKVRIEADGQVRSVSVAREAPSGHGFGAAARECLLSKRFSPALDLAGEPVSVVSPVTVRFSR